MLIFNKYKHFGNRFKDTHQKSGKQQPSKLQMIPQPRPTNRHKAMDYAGYADYAGYDAQPTRPTRLTERLCMPSQQG